MHRRRTAIALSAALAAAPLLTACGGTAHAGTAAVVGGQRITVTQLEGRVDEVRTAQRAAANDAQYEQVVAQTGSLTRNTLHALVLEQVLDRAAQDAGVTVDRGEVEQLRTLRERQVGGAAALRTAMLQQYQVAPRRLDDNLRTDVQVQKLATVIGADMGTEQGTALFWKAMSKASRELRVDINPRYGAWDMDKSSRVDATTPWIREVTAPPAQQTT
ncbi:SurA N-terminal domain-containing protein [Streptomyces sp. NPDC048664]|uniref:SurA N-terminal domain-containing protein n=1 Tax=Streptomyces sp. NPDC048664 TaxID=3154505 RepID=UPI00342D4DC5